MFVGQLQDLLAKPVWLTSKTKLCMYQRTTRQHSNLSFLEAAGVARWIWSFILQAEHVKTLVDFQMDLMGFLSFGRIHCNCSDHHFRPLRPVLKQPCLVDAAPGDLWLSWGFALLSLCQGQACIVTSNLSSVSVVGITAAVWWLEHSFLTEQQR